MAYIRFRGNTTQLLATVWKDGKNKQIVLFNLGGTVTITKNVQEVVEDRFPDVPIDWEAVQRQLDAGPTEKNEYQAIADKLRAWSTQLSLDPADARKLIEASDVLRRSMLTGN